VRGVIRRDGDDWQLTLEVLDGGERKSRLIAASSCEDLAEAAAVAIALALDAGAAERGDAANGDMRMEDTASVEGPALPAPAFAARFLAHAVLDTGSLPKAALGVGAELRADLPFASFGLYGVILPEQSTDVSAGGSLDFRLWLAGARACRQVLRNAVEGAACLGLDAGVLSAAGSGLALSRQVNELWLAPNAGFELGARLSQQLAVLARTEAAFPLVRRPYVINDSQRIHRPPVLAPRVFVGLSWALQ
jgi:hypothetical protein